MSQAALAAALGVARNTIARWERSELEIRHPELIQIALDRIATGQYRAADEKSRSGPAQGTDSDLQCKEGVSQHDGGLSLHAMPPELTSFVGRERELSAVRRLLETAPLITLSGAGGSGKTRLALQVARRTVDRFPDGVYFVDLTGLSSRELVQRAVAAVLGVRERPGGSVLQTLQAVLHTSQLLLVLDNCEHLLDACARLIDGLLQVGTGLRVLATSREPLKVAGEVIWPLAPLMYPDSSSNITQVDLERFEATRLFVERGRARQPDFVPCDVDASAIAAICQRLDGLPLAIELAAARLTVLSCSQLAGRLDEALPLLTTGVRTAPARHQTLRATVDWSHALLTPAEQLVFRRLAVFAGGWNLEAAESICGDDRSKVSGKTVLDLLERLVDKSLVVSECEAGERRFRFLETIRQYAAEQLADAGEVDFMRGRHLRWSLAMVVGLVGNGTTVVTSLSAFASLEQEHDNLRSAFRWSIEAAEIETGLALGAAMYQFWYVHGDYSEGIAWLSELLEHPKASGPRLQRLTALLGIGLLATIHGRYAEAQEWLSGCLSLADEVGDLDHKSGALHFLGLLAQYRGEHALARADYEQALLIQRQLGSKLDQATILVDLARLDLGTGDSAAAVARGAEALTLARASKFPVGEAAAAQILGRAAHAQGRFSRAQRFLSSSLTLYRQMDHPPPHRLGLTLTALGLLALDTGERSRARDYFREALSLAQRVGEALLIATLIEQLGGLSAGRHPRRAVTLAGAAVAQRQMLGASASDWDLSPKDRARTEEWRQVARRELGDPAFMAAWHAGRVLPLEEAIRVAASVEAGDVHVAPVRTGLSRREREVAGLVAQGCTNQQIAARLIFSEATAAKHVEHILAKLGFTSRVQIASWHFAAFDDGQEMPAN
jgi:predicted ATPase/DNA-binding CsgD family transcriptional regulator